MARLTLEDFSPADIARFGVTQADLDRAYNAERGYLDTPVKQITDERWEDMLGVLPPMNWHSTQEGINVFFMSEFMTGSITTQFGRFNGKYIEKYVDYEDKSTWINMGDMVNAD